MSHPDQPAHEQEIAEAEADLRAAGQTGDLGRILLAAKEYENAKLRGDAARARQLIGHALNLLGEAAALVGGSETGQLPSAPGPLDTPQSLLKEGGLPIYSRHRGTRYDALLFDGWRVELDGQVFSAPSPAAKFITGYETNGWQWWRYRDAQTGEDEFIGHLRRAEPRATFALVAGSGMRNGIQKEGTVTTTEPTNAEEIEEACRQLGREADVSDIMDRVELNRGGRPPQYASDRTYRATIQKVIEDHCPQSTNFRGQALFERVARGRYRLSRDL